MLAMSFTVAVAGRLTVLEIPPDTCGWMAATMFTCACGDRAFGPTAVLKSGSVLTSGL